MVILEVGKISINKYIYIYIFVNVSTSYPYTS